MKRVLQKRGVSKLRAGVREEEQASETPGLLTLE